MNGGRIIIYLFLILLISNVSASNILFAEGDKSTFISQGNVLYGIDKNEDTMNFEYFNDATISNLIASDWNSDGIEDAIFSSVSLISPGIKIIDGKTGKEIDSFYLVQKSYVSNSVVNAKKMILIGSELFFSSEQTLYKLYNKKLNPIAFFPKRILEIKENFGEIEVSVDYGQKKEIYTLNSEGKILNKFEIQLQNSIYNDYNSEGLETNCDENLISKKNMKNVIADLSFNSFDFYCKDNYVYYVNDTNYLIKRSINSKIDFPIKKLSCSPTNIFGEIVVCNDKILLGGGEEILLLQNKNSFVSAYDSDENKEVLIKNLYPFNGRYGDKEISLGNDKNNDSFIQDIYYGSDWDEDGNKELVISFSDSGMNGLISSMIFFELKTGEKNSISFKLTEEQYLERKKNIDESILDFENKIKKLEDDKEEILDDLENESLSENEEYDLRDELSSISEKINSYDVEINELDFQKRNIKMVEYISSFDVCDKKIYLTTEEGIYSYDKSKKVNSISNSEIYGGNYKFLACIEDSKTSWKKGLAGISYDGISILKRNGELVEENAYAFTNESLFDSKGVVKIRKDDKIYVFLRDFSNRKYIKLFDSDLKFIREESLDDSFQQLDVRNGNFFLCQSKEGISINFFGQDFIKIQDEKRISNFCENIYFADCDGDKKDEVMVFFKDETGILENCLDSGDDLIFPFLKYDWDSPQTLNAKKINNYTIIFLMNSKDPYGNSVFSSDSAGMGKKKEPFFPFEVYDENNEKIIISEKPLLFDDGKFRDFDGKEKIISKDIISNFRIEEEKIWVNFYNSNYKIIFVDGFFYDIIDSNEILMNLNSGNHEISFYEYSEDYFFEKLNVTISPLKKISIFSIIYCAIIFLLFIFIIKKRRVSV